MGSLRRSTPKAMHCSKILGKRFARIDAFGLDGCAVEHTLGSFSVCISDAMARATSSRGASSSVARYCS